VAKETVVTTAMYAPAATAALRVFARRAVVVLG
jgi:hypothetical protein